MTRSSGKSVVPSWRKGALTFVVAAAGLVIGVGLWGHSDGAAARESGPAPSVGVVHRAQLPVQAQQTESLIRAGGPFPYSKDGTVFFNREGLLPRQSRGHYREYTVPTPGARDRGARRIVCGGRQPRDPEACFYTDDHYASFRRIAP